jgi:hypothetical protein
MGMRRDADLYEWSKEWKEIGREKMKKGGKVEGMIIRIREERHAMEDE